MKTIFSILSLLLLLPQAGTKHAIESKKDLEKQKYLNYLTAVQNESTFSYFTVITARDLNTGIEKEICIKGNFLNGALHKEFSIDYDAEGRKKILEFARSRTNRTFEFKNIAALENISFYDYQPTLVNEISLEYNIDKVVEIIKNKKEFAILLPIKKMSAFAHLLFNEGILTGENSCAGGILEYMENPVNKN